MGMEQKPSWQVPNHVQYAIILTSELLALAWIYVDAPAALLAVLNGLILILSLMLVWRYNGTRESKEGYENLGAPGGILPLFPLALHFGDYNFHSFVQFIAPVAIFIGGILLLHILFNARRRLLLTAAVLLFIILPSSTFVVGNLNVLLDDDAYGQVQTAIVRDKPYYSGVYRFESYRLALRAPVDDKLKVKKDVYDAVEIGDEVLVVTRTGIFGIDYREIILKDEGEGQ